MRFRKNIAGLIVAFCFITGQGIAQVKRITSAQEHLRRVFNKPPEAAKPWVFWYWMYGAVSKAGITADLEAMKRVGIGGAYLMPIKSPDVKNLMPNSVQQLTPEWWALVKFSMQEADRVGVKLAMHVSDGFALAGGPWITPEMSMQKVVWAKKIINGGKTYRDTLPMPKHHKDFYKDIRIVAYPSLPGEGISSYDFKPRMSTSLPNTEVQHLAERGNKKSFSTAEKSWFQLEFEQPFTTRSLIIHTSGSNYQSQRLIVEVSNDGKTFRSLGRLTPPRHGWQDGDAEITHSIPETTAKYFRFVYDKTGSEPGAEDLDYAKWKPSFKFTGIELLGDARINQYESKTGEVWRVSRPTSPLQVPDALCIQKNRIVDLTDKLDANGRLNWNAPAGKWTIMRLGHTSTGQTNATGGAGKGLECDKFNPEAVKIQFKNWYGEAFKQGGDDLAVRVLKLFHVDSWECGSQNWSPLFAAEFKKRRGYDLLPYMPLFAGVPIGSAEESEKVLHDVRETVGELVVANFYKTLAELAHNKGAAFSAESIAPTMLSDGLLHYKTVDIPMGEFWFRSPTHDKPNDMLDAISGGHIYGKNIIQAEGFTQLRLFWDEDPAMLKPMADRNLALGINRLVFHVGAHNPWTDRKPGMTLDGIGMFFQRDQTWWETGKAWFDYIARSQALLQMGKPVVDIAVFSGEEMPRRSVLPERLVSTLPGLFGDEAVKREQARMANVGEPIRNMPSDASHSANIATADLFTDPLRGYAYDSVNPDALLQSTVKNGRIVLASGASYGVLVFPGSSVMDPANRLSFATINKIEQLVKAGGKVIFKYDEDPIGYPGYGAVGKRLFDAAKGKNSVALGGYSNSNLDEFSITRDFIATEKNQPAKDIAWTHRTGQGFDIYFVSNQQEAERKITVSLRAGKLAPEIFDPVTGRITQAENWKHQNGRAVVDITLPANVSLFVVLDQPVTKSYLNSDENIAKQNGTKLKNWQVQFDAKWGGPKEVVKADALFDWSKRSEDGIKHYSGTAAYTSTFNWKKPIGGKTSHSILWLDLGKVANLGQVYINGKYCGTAWTYPYGVRIENAVKQGVNKIEIWVTNTWANRVSGDNALPEDKRFTWTNAPYRLEGRELLPAGLLGPVTLYEEVKE